ncbi:polynucleotide kinase [Arthrobacter phage Molivia]|uniref:Polynucleotide kinase n=1 Tax=Arthrobacter phage Molivia TaxID=2015839 RepID=A0A286S1T0_9CAUD|nr:polynucleotide kinase [Arthrobacter phage Molivia]ASX99288.1 polynucleotide kinase [Arthrobacter phage Molivia]
MTYEIKRPLMSIYRGMPGCGKSTDALKAQKAAQWRGQLAIIVERDQIRRELNPTREKWYYGEFEDEVTALQRARIKAAFTLGADVLVSDTNLPSATVKSLMRLGVNAGAEVQIVDMRNPQQFPLDLLLKRDRERHPSKRVGEEFLRGRYERFIQGKTLTNPELPEVTQELVVEPYEQPDTDTTAWIFDIDGTLAIMGDRHPHDGHLVHLDSVNEDVRLALHNKMDMGHYIYIVTGRDEKYRAVTEKWLVDNKVPYDALFMRPTEPEDQPKTEDSVVKHDLFNLHIRDLGHRIAGVYDDRHRVLRMWRKLGLTTFHINGPDAGNF